MSWSFSLTPCRACARRTLRSLRRYATAAPVANLDIYDVVCVGGGPAGLSLLAALRASRATSHLKLALVESQDLDRVRRWKLPGDQYSNRVSSLTPSSVAFLEAIGAWKHVRRPRVQPYGEMQVWDGVSGARISFDWPSTSAYTGMPRASSDSTIAYMAENLNLTAALLARLDELGGVSVFDRSKVEHIGHGPETDTLDLSGWPVVDVTGVGGHRQLAARLLVGADGANSPVRKFADIESRGWDYDREAVVATVELEGTGWGGDSRKTAYQRFLPTGPIALLPLPNEFSTLVWSTLPSHAAFLKALSPTDFVAMVNAGFRLSPVDLGYLQSAPRHSDAAGESDSAATRSDVGGEVRWREQHTRYEEQMVPQRVVAVQQGSIASFPLRMKHADTYIGERTVLVGDAAHTIHPLAGQGLNQGQGDVQALARTIEYAVAHGQDIGSSSLSLQRYESARYATNHVLMGVVDKLHKLYSVRAGPLVPLRSWGLASVNALSPLKSWFMRTAAGENIST